MGSLASDDPSADALIINAVDRTLCSQRFGTASRVVIYKADADGSILDHDALESELVAQQMPGARHAW